MSVIKSSFKHPLPAAFTALLVCMSFSTYFPRTPLCLSPHTICYLTLSYSVSLAPSPLPCSTSSMVHLSFHNYLPCICLDHLWPTAHTVARWIFIKQIRPKWHLCLQLLNGIPDKVLFHQPHLLPLSISLPPSPTLNDLQFPKKSVHLLSGLLLLGQWPPHNTQLANSSSGLLCLATPFSHLSVEFMLSCGPLESRQLSQWSETSSCSSLGQDYNSLSLKHLVQCLASGRYNE